jgi:hypothetical protein
VFTGQANQIVTAMRGAGGSAQSAQDMVQALCNCAQTLEHRGPVNFNYTDPLFPAYPTTQPPPGRVEPFNPQSRGGANGGGFPQINVTFPPIPGVTPWTPATWNDIPPVDVPTGTRLPYPWGPGNGGPANPGDFTPWTPNAGVTFSSPVSAPQVTISGPTYTNEVYTQNVINNGDTYNQGDTYNEGDVYVGGDTINEGDVNINCALNIGGPLTTNNTTTTNNYTYNFGPQHNYSESWFFGPVNFNRKQIIRIGGVDMRLREQDVVTRVWFQDNILRTVTRRLLYLGTAKLPWSRVVFTVVSGGASFDEDTCEIVPDNGENPQITFVQSIDPPA